MLEPIRAVSPRIQSRCPECHCFVRLDAGTCTACGFAFALWIKAKIASGDSVK
jgi:predicted Zn-ribbon and HTH transcriptional regulator